MRSLGVKYKIAKIACWVVLFTVLQSFHGHCSSFDAPALIPMPQKIVWDKFHFKIVEGGLYKRKLKPEYPPKSDFTLNGKFDEDRYYLVVRAITWETAHLDIEQQKKKRVKPINFEVTGVCYDKNRNNPNFFRDDAPPEIKELAKNLSDRTHRLWDKAMRYVLEPEFVYKIKNVRLT